MPSEVLLIIFTFNLITPHQPSAKEYMVPTNLLIGTENEKSWFTCWGKYSSSSSFRRSNQNVNFHLTTNKTHSKFGREYNQQRESKWFRTKAL